MTLNTDFSLTPTTPLVKIGKLDRMSQQRFLPANVGVVWENIVAGNADAPMMSIRRERNAEMLLLDWDDGRIVPNQQNV